MNERIRELAEQSRWQEIVVEDGEEWIHAHFLEDKFARLIIQECAAWVDANSPIKLGAALKQHFGVES